MSTVYEFENGWSLEVIASGQNTSMCRLFATDTPKYRIGMHRGAGMSFEEIQFTDEEIVEVKSSVEMLVSPQVWPDFYRGGGGLVGHTGGIVPPGLVIPEILRSERTLGSEADMERARALGLQIPRKRPAVPCKSPRDIARSMRLGRDVRGAPAWARKVAERMLRRPPA